MTEDHSAKALIHCESLLSTGDITSAKEASLSLRTITPKSEEEWRRIRAVFLTVDDKVWGQVCTERFLGNGGDSAYAHLAISQYLMANHHDWGPALEALQRALLRPVQSCQFWIEVAKIQKATVNHSSSKASSEKALGYDENSVEAREILIECLWALGDHRAVRKQCTILSGYAGQDPLMWAKVARIAAEAGDMKQAAQAYTRATAYYDATNDIVEFDLVRTLIHLGRPNEAEQHLLVLLTSASRNPWIWDSIFGISFDRGYYALAVLAGDQRIKISEVSERFSEYLESARRKHLDRLSMGPTPWMKLKAAFYRK